MRPLRRIAPKAPATVSPHSDRIVKRCHNQHSKAKWEEKRDLISRLYIQQKQSAEAVVEILKTDASDPFVTSRRQLFTKLKEWDIVKQPRKHPGIPNQQDIPLHPGDISSSSDIADTPSSLESLVFSDHVSPLRSPPEVFASSNEPKLSPDKDSGHEVETNALEDDSGTVCLDPQQPECHGDRPGGAQNDQVLGRRELDHAIDVFDQEFIQVDNLEDSLSPETEFPRVPVGDEDSSPNEHVGQLLSWDSSERKTIEESGNGITEKTQEPVETICEKDGMEWELLVDTWLEREKSRAHERDLEEKLQAREHNAKNHGKHASRPSDPSNHSANLDDTWDDLLGEIDEMDAVYRATDDLDGKRHEWFWHPSLEPPHQPPQSQSSSHATPSAHQAARDDLFSLDQPFPYPAHGGQDQSDLVYLCCYPNMAGPPNMAYPDQRAYEHHEVGEEFFHPQVLHSHKLTRKTLRSLIRSLEGERRQNIACFRENFKRQYRLLVDTVRQYPIWLNTSLNQLRSHRDAWDSAVSTMRRLSRLEAPLSLGDAMCLLCASRAVVESSEKDKVAAYTASFVQDLETWRQIFPQVEHFAEIMWDLTMDHVPSFLHPADEASRHHSTILRLRELVAALVTKTRFLFGLEEHWSVIEADPPDSQICPNITRLRCLASKTPGCDPTVVALATGFIFALVIHFVLGLVHMHSTQILGLSNPPRIGTGSDESNPRELCSPSMLSRPSTPFAQWRPNLGIPSLSSDLGEFSDYFSRFSKSETDSGLASSVQSLGMDHV
ncbi:hypothetical protein B0I37DRAFT_73319 [Chaetomium sp. MPI-CAGE-AT-0009]|nr:hypothetical protein B0I37DRAFT_73319 [Chaetomium sp. MPI-CAGE-AT-0009]